LAYHWLEKAKTTQTKCFAAQIYLNPAAELSDLPLKSFYRYALPDFPPASPPAPSDAAAGASPATAQPWLGMPGPPVAAFSGLPSTKILTLNMDVPEAWLVEPVRAELDLDNLRLADLGAAPSLAADFELEALLLSGSCVDVSARRRDQVAFPFPLRINSILVRAHDAVHVRVIAAS
jgi:UDP-glucose:glycoprotein glucosyltransferase